MIRGAELVPRQKLLEKQRVRMKRKQQMHYNNHSCEEKRIAKRKESKGQANNKKEREKQIKCKGKEFLFHHNNYSIL